MSLPWTSSAHAAISPASRARSIVATEPSASWTYEGETCALSFVDEAGTPLLLVPSDTYERMLVAGRSELLVRFPETAGAVLLAGHFWSVADSIASSMLRQIRSAHASCCGCPETRASHVVGIDIVEIELRLTDGQRWSIPPEDYQRAQVDELTVVGLQLAEHVGRSHGPELRQAAADLTGQRPENVLSASVEWIQPDGVSLVVIDDTQARRVWRPFDRPATTTEDLIAEVTTWLAT